MGKLLDKFLDGEGIWKADRLKAGTNLVIHSIPWLVGLNCFIGGAYGLESFLAIDFSKNVVENLKKNKMLSDAQKDFYIAIGNKVLDKTEGDTAYKKMMNKKLGKIDADNSLVTAWKSVYDK